MMRSILSDPCTWHGSTVAWHCDAGYADRGLTPANLPRLVLQKTVLRTPSMIESTAMVMRLELGAHKEST